MQRGVTVALATVWLVVVGVVEAVSLRSSQYPLDQYSPLPPRRHEVYGRANGQASWKDEDPAEDQPLDLSIGPRRSIHGNEPQRRTYDAEYAEKDLILPWKDGPRHSGFSNPEFTNNERPDYRDAKSSESFSHEIPPSELDDPFVADDTFQDQGPGSVEIYKLDLFKEKTLLSPTPTTRPSVRNKSKAPKKTAHVNWKTKPTEYKSTSGPKVHNRQPNRFFNELRTESPPNSEAFGVGGVPELQVGCEGLEASSHKLTRSIDDNKNVKEPFKSIDPLLGVTPISLDLDYELTEEAEEMDELVKLKNLETTMKKARQNRGDMEATMNSDFETPRQDKLPVRGDLGKIASNGTTLKNSSIKEKYFHSLRRRSTDEELSESKSSSEEGSKEEFSEVKVAGGQKRKLLWLEGLNDATREELSRSKRSAVWGFNEDEGVVTSDELHTEHERRRQHDKRRYSDMNQNMEIDRIREEYESMLRQREREEEERRRRINQSSSRSNPYSWPEEERRRQEERRREEEMRRREREDERRRRVQEEESRRQEEERRRRIGGNPNPSHSANADRERERRLEWLRRRQEEEARMREQVAPSNLVKRPSASDLKTDEEKKLREQRERELEDYIRRNQPINANRTHDYWEQEERRRLEEERRKIQEERRRAEEERRRLEQERRIEDQRRRIESGRRRAEEERRRNEEAEEKERRADENRRREEEYRRQGSNRTREDLEYRKRLEEHRRRILEEERLKDYVARNQPTPSNYSTPVRNQMGNRRVIAETPRPYDVGTRYPSPSEGRRQHGPSAPTSYIDYEVLRRREEERRLQEERTLRDRQRQEEEARRREALRREEEYRRTQSQRYEEQRKRQEAARLEAERRRKELIEEAERRGNAVRVSRPQYEDTIRGRNRRPEEPPRRRPTSSSVGGSDPLAPSNLVLDESRRMAERERQRQEQARRLEAERLREQRRKEEHARGVKEQWRRQEQARLNSLPGINPSQGVQAPRFPSPKTSRPPTRSPGPCVWAVVQCCSSNRNRLVHCFESAGCPGSNWDPDPCRSSILEAAEREITQFYATADEENNY